MPVLVTGAFGFVGSAVVGLLAARGETVVATDMRGPDEVTRRRLEARGADVVFRHLDVTDAGACRAVLNDVRPRRIIHAAALTQADSNPQTMARTLSVNLGGTMNLLAAAALGSVERIVVASSSGVYGAQGGDVPCREDESLPAGAAYAASKQASEIVAACYGGMAGASIVAARIGPAYGPFERGRDSRPQMSAVGRLFAALADARSVTVSGVGVARDWTHVDDIAGGLAALLDAPVLSYGVYNVSCGISRDFADVVAWFAAAGLPVRWTDDPATADVAQTPRDARRPLAIDRLRADTDFAPAYTLETGLARVWADLRLLPQN